MGRSDEIADAAARELKPFLHSNVAAIVVGYLRLSDRVKFDEWLDAKETYTFEEYQRFFRSYMPISITVRREPDLEKTQWVRIAIDKSVSWRGLPPFASRDCAWEEILKSSAERGNFGREGLSFEDQLLEQVRAI